MTKTLRALGLSAFLLTGVAGGAFAATEGGDTGSQTVTGQQTGSQQTNVPATGSSVPMGTMTNTRTGTANPQTRTSMAPVSPDAAQPNSSTPSGGGPDGGGSGGAAGGSASGGGTSR